MRRVYIPLLCLFVMLCMCDFVSANTLIVEGTFESGFRVEQKAVFNADRSLESLAYKFPVPMTFSGKTVSQTAEDITLDFDPRPAMVEDLTDDFGNSYKVVTWKNVRGNPSVTMSYKVKMKSDMSAVESMAAFPLQDVPDAEKGYLNSTKSVQSDSDEVVSLAKKLTDSVAVEHEAVTAIFNYVADSVKYAYNPPSPDALYTLRTGSGNCTNFAHLSVALLRAAGIPAKVVAGTTLGEKWKVTVGRGGSFSRSMGQGKHAWVEVYFPDIGWLLFDPQQSRLFTSTRHIKFVQGLDVGNIGGWSGIPYAPSMEENIEATTLYDNVSLSSKASFTEPQRSIVSIVGVPETVPEKKVVEERPAPQDSDKRVSSDESRPVRKKVKKQPPPQTDEKKTAQDEKQRPDLVLKKPSGREERPKPVKDNAVVFGNMEFPETVSLSRIAGNRGVQTFDRETAEYVTSKYIYAQAFTVKDPFQLRSVSLAMRKFGGDGMVFVDVVADDNGRPGRSGTRSSMVPLETIKKRPGYAWTDFIFSPDSGDKSLKNGVYWIILRHSGEAIMNWFYVPGTPYGDIYDTRSTLKGYKWDDIQDYDFVFRVRGIRQP